MHPNLNRPQRARPHDLTDSRANASDNEGAAIVACRGDLLDIASVNHLDDRVQNSLSRGHPIRRLCIDLSRVTQCGSPTIAVLVRAARRARAADVAISIMASPIVLAWAEVYRLTAALRITPAAGPNS